MLDISRNCRFQYPEVAVMFAMVVLPLNRLVIWHAIGSAFDFPAKVHR